MPVHIAEEAYEKKCGADRKDFALKNAEGHGGEHIRKQ